MIRVVEHEDKRKPDAVETVWMEAQKDVLNKGRLDEALVALAPHREAPEVSDDNAQCGHGIGSSAPARTN